MEKKEKPAIGEFLRNAKKKVILLLSSVAHSLIRELKTLGTKKADANAGPLKTAYTHFHILR